MVLVWSVRCMPPQMTSRPYACASGSGSTELVTFERTDCWWAADPHQYRPAWVSGTPLDRPVVPPV